MLEYIGFLVQITVVLEPGRMGSWKFGIVAHHLVLGNHTRRIPFIMLTRVWELEMEADHLCMMETFIVLVKTVVKHMGDEFISSRLKFLPRMITKKLKFPWDLKSPIRDAMLGMVHAIII
jgi:hypothetical protein